MAENQHTGGPAQVSRPMRILFRLRRMLWTLLPLAAGLLIASGLDNSGAVERLRNAVFDQYQRWSPRQWNPDGPVRVVLVDDESIARHGQWPWPHETFVKLVERLGQAGAATIAFDVVFADRDRLANRAMIERLPALPERDALMGALKEKGLLDDSGWANAIGKAPVVLGYVLAANGQTTDVPAKWGMANAGDDPRPFLTPFPKAILPLKPLIDPAMGLGAFNMAADLDLLIRRVPLFFRLGAGDNAVVVPSLTAEALRTAQRASTYIVKSSNASGEYGFGQSTGVVAARIGAIEIPTGKDASVRVHFSGTQQGRRIPAWKVLSGDFDPKQVEGRIILVGVGALGIADFRATPLEASVPGVEAHAEMIEQAVSGVTLVRPDYAIGLEFFVLLSGALALLFAIARLRALSAAIFTFVLVAGVAIASWLAFRHLGYLFDPLVSGATWLSIAGLGLVSAYRRTEREKQFVRSAFSRYLAPAVVERIAADPSQLSLGGETRDVTILFSDVRDFTTRSESLNAAGVVHFLNALHTPFTGAVLAERGTIDKYIGDGLMAFWNAPLNVPDHANRACAAALAMLALVPEIDATLAADAQRRGAAHMPLRIGIGVNTGEVFVGNMGSDQRFDYSIVGDPVNVAARLETATKELAFPILVSQATRDAADAFAFVELGAADLKGKAERTPVFALHGRKDQTGPDFEAFCTAHRAVLASVEAGGAAFDMALEAVRNHPLAARYEPCYARLAAHATRPS
ncbi:MAG: CHASE2 domain-containing protein [Beijerinckiaceae bacterium]